MEGEDTMITMQRAQEKGKKDVKVIRKFTDAGIEVQMICEDVVSEQFFSRNWIKSNGTSQHLYWFFLSSTTVLHIQKNEKAQKNCQNATPFFIDSISDKSLQTLWGFEFGDVQGGGLQAGVVPC